MYSLPILWEKGFFSYSVLTKNSPLWVFFSCNLPREEQAAVSLDFDHVWVSEDPCQIWCFIQNLHLQKQPTRGILKVGLSSSKKTRVICFLENPLEITKNAFYFILEAPFVLRIFKFLS